MGRKKINQEEIEIINDNAFQPKIRIKGLKLSEKQKKFVDIALDPECKIIFVSGPAGSTKTYMAVFAALRQLRQDGELDLLYVRTAIESAEKRPWSPSWHYRRQV